VVRFKQSRTPGLYHRHQADAISFCPSENIHGTGNGSFPTTTGKGRPPLVISRHITSVLRSFCFFVISNALRAYAKWEADKYPRLTHRGGVPADVIQAILSHIIQSPSPQVFRTGAAIVLAYVLCLHKSSLLFLPAGGVTSDDRQETAQLLVINGKALRHPNRAPAISRLARRASGVAPRRVVHCTETLPCGNPFFSSGWQDVVFTLLAYWCAYLAHASWVTR
jgi:hypothetical protein